MSANKLFKSTSKLCHRNAPPNAINLIYAFFAVGGGDDGKKVYSLL